MKASHKQATQRDLSRQIPQPGREEKDDDDPATCDAAMKKRLMQSAKRLDEISRVVVPGAFFLINVLYWATYG